MACENVDFLLAALHWQKGELNQVILFVPRHFVPFPALGSVSCIEAPVDLSPSSPRWR